MGRGCRAAIAVDSALRSERGSIILSRRWGGGDGVLVPLLAHGCLMYARERQCFLFCFVFYGHPCDVHFFFYFCFFCLVVEHQVSTTFSSSTGSHHRNTLNTFFINWFIQVGWWCRFKCITMPHFYGVTKVLGWGVVFFREEKYIFINYKYSNIGKKYNLDAWIYLQFFFKIKFFFKLMLN